MTLVYLLPFVVVGGSDHLGDEAVVLRHDLFFAVVKVDLA
jgi:hypothetical protein